MDSSNRALPLVPLRGLAVFPYMVLHFDAGREKSVSALEVAMLGDQMCFLVAQKDARVNDLHEDDVYSVGVVAHIKQILKLPGESVRVLVEGVKRGRIVKFLEKDPHFEVEIEDLEETPMTQLQSEALSRSLTEAFERYNRTNGKVTAELLMALIEEHDSSKLIDIIAANVLVQVEDKQEILEETGVWERAQKLLSIINRETEIKKLEVQLQNEVRKNIEKGQKEYFLREQINVIRKELGDEDSPEAEAEEFMEKLAKLELPDEVREKAEKEIKRCASLPNSAHESPVLRTWIETFFELPWNVFTQDNFDVPNAREVLENDHYGLEKVKDRILEQLAVCKMRGNTKGTLLCLVGPPGVGKTSVASSIARAAGRNFVRISLGGVRDEAEIRGHRRTYVGAMPGRIINAMRQAKSMNPIILLDEIDKMASDSRGDPASAMLEVLDGEQNYAFRDNYMEIPFDLSNVMFIMTANTLDTVPRPLLDRMEVVELNSYTSEEKFEIARRHLVPKQIKAHGIAPKALKFSDEALEELVGQYTREAGVRNLERRIADVCRKVCVQMLEGRKRVVITSRQLPKLLGAPRYKHEHLSLDDKVGVATGLAWTSVGGDTLSIEVATLHGDGKLELTGQLGDVMKESAQAGFTYIRANAAKWGIDPEFDAKTDIHIHIPDGATPKDGPSAGITMVTAMVSALSGIPVRGNVAMTGEVTLRGRVLPIGGLKEKSIAALRDGITKLILPEENRRNLEDIPQCVKDNISIVFAQDMDDVLANALTEKAAIIVPIKPAYEAASPVLN